MKRISRWGVCLMTCLLAVSLVACEMNAGNSGNTDATEDRVSMENGSNSKREVGKIIAVENGMIVFKNTRDEVYWIDAANYPMFKAEDEAWLIYKERVERDDGTFDVEPVNLYPSYSGPTIIYN